VTVRALLIAPLLALSIGASTAQATAESLQYVVLSRTAYRTDLRPPLELRLATDEVLEWPFATTGITVSPPEPASYEARLRMIVAGGPHGARVPTRATRSCTTYDKYDGATSTTTRSYALVLRFGVPLMLPAAGLKVHDDVGCSWLFRLTIVGTRRPAVTLYAPAIITAGYVPDVLTPQNTRYDRESCIITQLGGSTTRACKPLP
jgi:hypothetical protein